jgi:hypothetical protein
MASSFDFNTNLSGIRPRMLAHLPTMLRVEGPPYHQRSNPARNSLQNLGYRSLAERIRVQTELTDTQKNLATVHKDMAGTKRELADTKKDLADAQKDMADTKKKWEDTKRNRELVGGIGFVVGLVLGLIAMNLLSSPQTMPSAQVCTEKELTFIIYTPDFNTNVSPGQSAAIHSKLEGMEPGWKPQMTWIATCNKDKDCNEALKAPIGDDNFLTAPNTPGDIVTVWATLKDKCGQEHRAGLVFGIGQ